MAARGLTLVTAALVLAACGGGGGGSSGGGSVGSASPQSGLVLPATNGSSSVLAESGSLGGLQLQRQGSSGTTSVNVGDTARTWQSGVTRIGDLGVYQATNGSSAVVTGGGSASSAAITSLTYTSYGVWLETSATGALTSSSDQITGAGGFVIGDATPPGDMPRAGSASYRGQAVAVELRPGQLPRTLSGTLAATADFGTGRVNATADLADAVGGTSFGRVTMNGLAISGNQFSGTASAGSLTGTVQGGFAGPRAAELGGSFELEGASTVHGAFAGSRR